MWLSCPCGIFQGVSPVPYFKFEQGSLKFEPNMGTAFTGIPIDKSLSKVSEGGGKERRGDATQAPLNRSK